MYQRMVAKHSFESKLEDRRKVGSLILRRLEDAEDYILELEVTGWRKFQIIKKNARLS
jgi:hypothetical protein